MGAWKITARHNENSIHIFYAHHILKAVKKRLLWRNGFWFAAQNDGEAKIEKYNTNTIGNMTNN